MTLQWAPQADSDLRRLHDFLADVDPIAAARVVRMIIASIDKIATMPGLGVRLVDYPRREVRRVIVGEYEVRYEVRGSGIFVLRLWHTREDR